MQRWVIAQNIARLERQLANCADEARRVVLTDLLNREKLHQRELDMKRD
jgi:hypothetical protein